MEGSRDDIGRGETEKVKRWRRRNKVQEKLQKREGNLLSKNLFVFNPTRLATANFLVPPKSN